MDLLFAVFVALLIWYFLGPRKKPKQPTSAWPIGSSEPVNAAKSFRADPLAHLDIKLGDRSITDASLRIPSKEDYQFEIVYKDKAGNISSRRLAWISWTPDGADTMIHAFCEEAQAERTFRSSRIISCRNVFTGRKINDLGQYLRRS